MEPPDLRGTGCKHCCVYQAPEPGDWRWREMQIYFMVKMTYPINKVYSSAHRVGVECLHMPSISLVLPTLSPALFCPFPHCVSLSLYLSRLLPSLCPPLFLSLPHLLPSLCLSLSISFPLLPSLVLLCDLFAAGSPAGDCHSSGSCTSGLHTHHGPWGHTCPSAVLSLSWLLT